MAVNSFWPKLIVSGSSAEQPSPASAKVKTPSTGFVFGAHALAIKAAVTTSGKIRQTISSGSHFSMTAKRIRPAVTVLQKIVSASDDRAALA